LSIQLAGGRLDSFIKVCGLLWKSTIWEKVLQVQVPYDLEALVFGLCSLGASDR
jgi:hypothetical protein